MKKLFALVLAVAMVLSMASVAMAANTSVEGNQAVGTWGGLARALYIENEDDDVYFVTKTVPDQNANTNKAGLTIPYGETVYIPLVDSTYNPANADKPTNKEIDAAQFTKADDVDALKVSAKWDKNGEYVESVEIVKKNSRYWVAIKTIGSSMSENDVEGTVTLSGKAYEYASDDKKTNVNSIKVDGKDGNQYDVILTLKYNELGKGDKLVDADKIITETAQVFRFDKEIMQDEEFELEVDDDDEDVTFTVDTTHQPKIVLSFTTDAIDEVEDKYADANLDFYVFNGATFKKTGELFIPADEGTYLYEIVDGAAKAVDAEYDDYDEGFYLKTKTLGAYVVSDVKLATAEAAAVDTTTTDTTANPTTGAAL